MAVSIDTTAMINWLVSAYYNAFMLLFAIVNVIIVLLLLKNILNVLFAREEDRSGSHALITGCDSGFGHATTYELNKRGVHVFAACLTEESVQKFKDDDNFKGTAFLMNVTKRNDIDTARCMIEGVVGDKGLWCLFNNAGILEPGPIEWMPEEDMRRSSEINLWGAVNVTKAMLPMIKKARGRIVNTTSIAGRISVPFLSSYHISKYAFEAFSDSLRLEMKPWGVSVHIIEPGVMPTFLYLRVKNRWMGLWDKLTKETRDAYGEDFLNNMLSETDDLLPKMFGNPKKVVDAYLHAALSTHPQLRYVVGLDAKFLAATVAILPTYIGDLLFKVLFKPNRPAGSVA